MSDSVSVAIGGTCIRIVTDDAEFRQVIASQYSAFLDVDRDDSIELELELIPAPEEGSDADLEVRREGELWVMERGDFRTVYNPSTRRGKVRQSASRYSLDSVIRIIHSLELARGGGLLLHAASAIVGGKAFIFSGVSGAGKTTISSLAPAHATLLTDEISYVRRSGGCFEAWGTPFAGELARAGENRRAPVGALYFLKQASENCIDTIAPAEALRLLLRNILFFAHDTVLVRGVFDLAYDFVSSAEIFQLSFLPDARVWELIG